MRINTRALRSFCMWLACLALVVVHRGASASPEDAVRTLGFESVATDWSIDDGQGSLASTATRTQGAAAIAVQSAGWTVVKSRLLGPLGNVFPNVTLDLLLPADAHAPNPWWSGGLQVSVSAPSIGVWGEWLGQVEFTGRPTGTFQSFSFPIAPALLEKLRNETYFDLTFSLSFSVPQGVTGSYVVDNLHVASELPPNSTTGVTELLSILDFEREDGWAIDAGSVLGSSLTSTSGSFSMIVQPATWGQLVSLPLVSIGPVDEVISFDLMPPPPADPWWAGSITLSVDAPSVGVWDQYLGQYELASLQPDVFHTLQFSVPPTVRNALNGTYSDLRFKISFSVPQGTGAFHLDRFQVGPITTPPAVLPPDTPIHRDLVGLASSGIVLVAAEGESASPALQLGAIYAEERDPGCIPSATHACRYLVHLLRFRVGSFHMLDTDFAGAQVVNQDPFQIVMGGNGAASLSSLIPSNVLFSVNVEGQSRGFSAFPGARSTVTIDPSGNGMMSVACSLHSTVDGHGIDFNFSVVADSPLANRRPVANAGPNRTVSSNGPCEVELTLDGSGSFDPDNNLSLLRWVEGNVSWGVGPALAVRLNHSGTHFVTLEAIDRFGAASRDDVTVTATLPPACP